jgi:hypothetical protein
VPIRLQRSKVETSILSAGALKKHTPADHPCRRTSAAGTKRRGRLQEIQAIEDSAPRLPKE